MGLVITAKAGAASGQAGLDSETISITAAVGAEASELVWSVWQMLRTRQTKASEWTPLVAVLQRNLPSCFVQQAFWKGGDSCF
jgi:hypothetical protein